MRSIPGILLLILFVPLALAAPDPAPLCEDSEVFADDGWEQPPVQEAMDDYLRDHRMRANWLDQPSPPDQIGMDYYQWLWTNQYGAAMKSELMRRFCGGIEP